MLLARGLLAVRMGDETCQIPSFSLRAVRLKPIMTSPSITVVGVACAPSPINSSTNRWSSAMFFSVNFTPLWDRNSVSRWQEDHPGCV